jgi:hypothetical protein
VATGGLPLGLGQHWSQALSIFKVASAQRLGKATASVRLLSQSASMRTACRPHGRTQTRDHPSGGASVSPCLSFGKQVDFEDALSDRPLVTMAVNRPTLTKEDSKKFFRVTDAELRILLLVMNDPEMPYEGRRSELSKTGGYWNVLARLARDKVEILTRSARPDPQSYSLSPSRGAGTPQPPGTRWSQAPSRGPRGEAARGRGVEAGCRGVRMHSPSVNAGCSGC